MANGLAAVKLTEQQAHFVEEVLAGRLPDDAARAAGYAENIAATTYRLLRAPAIAAAIRAGITQRLTVEAAPLAYQALIDIVKKDSTALPSVKRAAARDLLDRAGFVAPKAAEALQESGKSLHEMSSDELRTYIDKIESELGARATDVTPADNAQKPKGAAPKRLAFLG